MSRAVPTSTGQPTGRNVSHAKRPPQSIDFDYLNSLGGKAEREIRKTEEALVEFIASEQKRDALYADASSNFEAKYPAMRKEGTS